MSNGLAIGGARFSIYWFMEASKVNFYYMSGSIVTKVVDVVWIPDGKFTSMENTRIIAGGETGVGIQ